MAARELKAWGPRKDGGLLSGWARRLFRGRALEEVREIAFEIRMLGQRGAGHQRPQESHVLREQPRSVFSALDIEVDLGEG